MSCDQFIENFNREDDFQNMNFFQQLIQQITLWINKPFSTAAYPYKPFMHQYQCVFIHIPKTAGTSILKVFNDSGARWHLSWLHYFRANQTCFKNYYKFTVVREPIARLFSAYSYCLTGGNQSTFDITLQLLIKGNSIDFNSFIHNVLSADFILQQELFLPQYLYLYDRQLNCRVDKILRHESLSTEWYAMAVEQRLPQQLPKVNVTTAILENNKDKKTKPMPILSDMSLAKIQLLYQKDFELLDYPIIISKNSEMNESTL